LEGERPADTAILDADSGARAEGRGVIGGWRLVAFAAILAGVIALVAVWGHGAGEDGLRVALRATARFSVTIFLLVFVASPLARLWRSAATTWLLANRRYLGVSFAAAHTVHLAVVIALAQVSTRPYSRLTLVLGTIGYVALAAMVATSFDATAAWLGAKWWKRLHRTGLYYLWTIFFLTAAASRAHDPAAGPLAIVLLGAASIRILARRRASPTDIVTA
jgi:methionine sulfoxide reductase heme-binding subunit